MTDRLDGMVAVITGAATGIGRAIALHLRAKAAQAWSWPPAATWLDSRR
jgi:NAD(P)-dependent dehydrogenase (short-subunit alcohol dehydrogenase family)